MSLAREVWGTYSVRDHLQRHPWAADVLLYDRLVIPVPPAAESREWARWRKNGWEPERQQLLLEVLGDRAYPVEWTTDLQQRWFDLRQSVTGMAAQIRTEARRSADDPWMASAMVLRDGLPTRVTAVTAIATYRSANELAEAIRLGQVEQQERLSAGQAVVVIGREFLAPAPDQFRDDGDLLRAAVELAGDEDVRRRRTSYWRWQREFLRDGMFIDPESITAALEEMQDLVADEQRAVRRAKVRLGVLYALSVATVSVGLATGPLAPATLAAAFLSVGQFVAGEAFDAAEAREPSPAGLLVSARKELGWR